MRPEDILRHIRRMSRYTSYPTVADFTPAVDAASYRDWLDAIPPGEDVSCYPHIPFCHRLDPERTRLTLEPSVTIPKRIRRSLRGLSRYLLVGRPFNRIRNFDFCWRCFLALRDRIKILMATRFECRATSEGHIKC